MARNLYQYRVFAQTAREEHSFRKADRALRHCEKILAVDPEETFAVYARKSGGVGRVPADALEWDRIDRDTLRRWAASE